MLQSKEQPITVAGKFYEVMRNLGMKKKIINKNNSKDGKT